MALWDDEFWRANAHKSGEQIAREVGVDSGTVRRKIRQAKQKEALRDLDWYKKPDSASPKKGVGVWDLHHPEHDRRLWKNILRFVEDFRPDLFVFGGDNMNLDVISHWLENTRRPVEGKRLLKDYAAFVADVMEPLEERLPSGCRKIWLNGNHEEWVEQYIDKHPEIEGFFEIQRNIPLDGWEFYRYGDVCSEGKLYFMHGSYYNLHNAYKTASVYGRNIVYGHGHTFQAHTMTAPIDTHAHCAVQIPCACGLNPRYRKNQPNSWVNGFAVVYIWPNGNFNLYPVIATNGAFMAPTGKMYE